MAKRLLRVGVNASRESVPPKQWSILYLAIARDEAMSLLSEPQYHHIAEQFQLLAEERDPSHSVFCDIRAVESFFELRDKGGPLGRINVRVFFTLDHGHRAIVVLGTIKKEADGKTPLGDKIRMRVRKRRYESGDFGSVNRRRSSRSKKA
jgi:hypothetical protein